MNRRTLISRSYGPLNYFRYKNEELFFGVSYDLNVAVAASLDLFDGYKPYAFVPDGILRDLTQDNLEKQCKRGK